MTTTKLLTAPPPKFCIDILPTSRLVALMTNTQTRTAFLREAEALIRTRGYSAFSYADLSEKAGIRKASIHHHFPTKEALYLSSVVASMQLDSRSGKEAS